MTSRSRCPACGSGDVRLLIPEDPEGSAFRCGACGKRWDESSGMPRWGGSNLRAVEGRDDPTPSADAQPDRTPAGGARSNCPQCGSAVLTFIERMATGTVCQCDNCGRVTMFADSQELDDR